MNVIFTSCRSVTLELENRQIYQTEEPFQILLNGRQVEAGQCRNVFSLYGLEPDTEYVVEAAGQQVEFRTDMETLTLNVRDFYAKGDGESDDTGAIQAAILSCPPGGRVLIPEGDYRIKPIFLKSHIQIELQEGATLLGETDRHQYPILPGRLPMNDGETEYYLGTWEGKAESAFAGLITGFGVELVKLYGRGVIDGQADKSDWWVNDRVMRVAWRPRGIFLNGCRNIGLQGLTCRNTASWNQHPFFCQDVVYADMKLQNPKENPNTDGIDPESCKRVSIIGCEFSVGDDCIAIKSGKFEMGEKRKTPCEEVVIRNCLMQYGHGAVTLGSELSAGLKDITVTQCRFEKTDRGLRIKTQRGRGRRAAVDNVVFDNIEMVNVKAPLVVNMFYKARNNEPDQEYMYNHSMLPIDERTPCFGSFLFKNIRATEVEWAAGAFWGLPEQPVEEIRMENVQFHMREQAEPGTAVMTLDPPQYCKSGLHFYWVKKVSLKQVTVTGADTEPYILEHVEEMDVE